MTLSCLVANLIEFCLPFFFFFLLGEPVAALSCTQDLILTLCFSQGGVPLDELGHWPIELPNNMRRYRVQQQPLSQISNHSFISLETITGKKFHN